MSRLTFPETWSERLIAIVWATFDVVVVFTMWVCLPTRTSFCLAWPAPNYSVSMDCKSDLVDGNNWVKWMLPHVLVLLEGFLELVAFFHGLVFLYHHQVKCCLVQSAACCWEQLGSVQNAQCKEYTIIFFGNRKIKWSIAWAELALWSRCFKKVHLIVEPMGFWRQFISVRNVPGSFSLCSPSPMPPSPPSVSTYPSFCPTCSHL